MKKENLFEGAVVLARTSIYEKRSRCRILEVGDRLVKVKKGNLTFYTGIEHLKPAKITRNALKELGFVERETTCIRSVKPACTEYVYPTEEDWPWRPRIIMKDECDKWGPTRIFGGLGVHKVSYIHEVQRVINKINNQK